MSFLERKRVFFSFTYFSKGKKKPPTRLLLPISWREKKKEGVKYFQKIYSLYMIINHMYICRWMISALGVAMAVINETLPIKPLHFSRAGWAGRRGRRSYSL